MDISEPQDDASTEQQGQKGDQTEQENATRDKQKPEGEDKQVEGEGSGKVVEDTTNEEEESKTLESGGGETAGCETAEKDTNVQNSSDSEQAKL